MNAEYVISSRLITLKITLIISGNSFMYRVNHEYWINFCMSLIRVKFNETGVSHSNEYEDRLLCNVSQHLKDYMVQQPKRQQSLIQYGTQYSESQNPEGMSFSFFLKLPVCDRGAMVEMAANVPARVTELFCNLWCLWFRQSD
jgi:hypothetical protein